jgi:hypothetical protein
VNSHAAGMVSAASGKNMGKNISPQFGPLTSVKKKMILKFSAVKTLFPIRFSVKILECAPYWFSIIIT